MRVVLLAPNGQLGHDVRSAHEKAGGPFELMTLSRDRLDVATPGAIEETLGGLNFDALINCTSYHKTDEVEDNASQAFAVNTHAVKTMARVCAESNARFIHISTDFVFGGDVGRAHPLEESAPMAPVNVYGASKAMGETLAGLAWDDVVILRVASLFGVAGSSGKGGNFVETIIRLAREKGQLSVVNDQIMSPTGTHDIADVIIKILTGGCPPGVYHVVNSGQASWFDFAREIVRLTGIDATVSPCDSSQYPTRAERPRYSVLDNQKISDLFGPMPDWQDSLEEYLISKGHLTAGEG